MLGRGDFKFNDTPIEIETSITIISPLVEHPVSDFQTYSLTRVTCESQDTTCSLIEFRQHDFVKAGGRKLMMNGPLTHFRSLRIVKMEPYSVLKYHAKMAFMQLKKKHLNEFQYRQDNLWKNTSYGKILLMEKYFLWKNTSYGKILLR